MLLCIAPAATIQPKMHAHMYKGTYMSIYDQINKKRSQLYTHPIFATGWHAPGHFYADMYACVYACACAPMRL